MASDPRSTRPGHEGPARQAYHSPELRVYGDIRAVTQATRIGMNKDSGSPPSGKTG
jgi:hypothetical protein